MRAKLGPNMKMNFFHKIGCHIFIYYKEVDALNMIKGKKFFAKFMTISCNYVSLFYSFPFWVSEFSPNERGMKRFEPMISVS